MKELVGKTITGIRISRDDSILVFDTNQGTVAYAAWGECCSEAWFANGTGVRALLGGTVQTADDTKRAKAMKELIGKTITGIRVSRDESILVFYTNQGVVAYAVWGDCCSEAWFANGTGVRALLGGTVQTADEVSMAGYNTDDGRTRQECYEAFGVKLITDKGYADIVFRNSSNGFYGGCTSLIEGELPKGMITIEDDWCA